METLMQGRPVKVNKVDGSEEEVQVRQLPLKDYKKAFEKSDDEFELVAIIVGKHVNWVYELSPESYEVLLADCKQVNEKGFFVYCARRRQDLAEQLNLMNPQMARAVTERALSSGSPQSVPRPV